MIGDLYEEGRRRMHSSVRPDWKHEMGRAYEHYVHASHPDERERWMTELVLAFTPLLYHITDRYQNHGLGFSRRDAFDIGIVCVPRAVTTYDVEKHRGGVHGISSWIAHASEMAILTELRRRIRAIEHPSTCSLDALETDDTVDCLAVLDRHPQHQTSVRECIEKGLKKLSPQDEWMSRKRLFDELGWQDIARAGRDEGVKDISYEAWRQRWRAHVVCVLQHELERAGYDRSDMDGLGISE